MEREQKALNAFLKLHGHKAQIRDERCVHLTEYAETMPLNISLTQFSPENVISFFNMQMRPSQWLMQQVSTYDTSKERVVGLIFSKDVVLAQVIQLDAV